MQGLISGVLLVVVLSAIAVGAVVVAARLYRVSGTARTGGSPDA